jgi:Ribbon-helix-helix protein, copG family
MRRRGRERLGPVREAPHGIQNGATGSSMSASSSCWPPGRRARPAGSITIEKEIEALAAEAESGYDVDTLLARRGKRGRSALGSAPASVESVRLDPELREQLLERAKAEDTTTSEVIREALRRFLKAA